MNETQDFGYIIGMKADEALAALKEVGKTVRIIDGSPMTCEWRTDRVNLTLENDRVVEVNVG